MPPLFVLGPNGQSELVNYRVHPPYYIVDRLFAVAELRLGGRATAGRADRANGLAAEPGEAGRRDVTEGPEGTPEGSSPPRTTRKESLTQIENQILQLQNQAQMLLNQAKNLQGLNFTSLARLEATFSTTEQLLDQAQGITLDLTATQQQLARVYPAAYGSTVTRSQLDADQLTRWSSSLGALDTAMEVQAQAKQNLPSNLNPSSRTFSRAAARPSAPCRRSRRPTSCSRFASGRSCRASRSRFPKIGPPRSRTRGSSRPRRALGRCEASS